MSVKFINKARRYADTPEMEADYLSDKSALLKALYLLKEGKPFEEPSFRLKDSLQIWRFLWAQRAYFTGDVETYRRLRTLIATEDGGGLADLWLTTAELEETQGTTASLNALHSIWEQRDFPELKSPWGWAWRIEYHLAIHLGGPSLFKPAESIKHLTAAYELAKANEYLDRLCAVCVHWSYFYSEIVADRLQSLKWLEELKIHAERYQSDHYIAYYFFDLATIKDQIGEHKLALRLMKKARDRVAAFPNSMTQSLILQYSVQVFCRLGLFESCLKAISELRVRARDSARGADSSIGNHIFIEGLELALAQHNIPQIWDLITRYNLKNPACCFTRVWTQLLRAEIFNPGESGAFFNEALFQNIEGGARSEYYGLQYQIFKLMYFLKTRQWRNEQDLEYFQLQKKIGVSPYPWLHYLSAKLEVFMRIMRRKFDGLEHLLEETLDHCERWEYRSESLYLLDLWDQLTRTYSVSKMSAHQKKRYRDLSRRFGKRFLQQARRAWPQSELVSTRSLPRLRWDMKRGSIWVDDLREVSLTPGSHLSMFARLLITAPGGTLTYSQLTRAMWGEPYSKSFHGHRIQVLAHELRKALSEAQLPMDLLVSVRGKGYSLRHEERSGEATERGVHGRLKALKEFLKGRTEVTSREVRTHFGITERQAQRDLNRLVALGLLTPTGARKNRRYRVNAEKWDLAG